MEDQWVKDMRYNGKVVELAPSDHHIFNDILSPEELIDLSNP